MKLDIKAYIDTYNEITLLVQKRTRYRAKNFYLYDDEDLVEELQVLYQSNEQNLIKLGLRVTSKLNLHHNYTILDNLHHVVNVYSGSVVRTTEFESEFFYDGPLGFEYTKDYTVFRVWSPVAKSVILNLKTKAGCIDRRELYYARHGVWEIEMPGDLDGASYYYSVKVFDRYEKVLDPYAVASSANQKENYVIDKNKLYSLRYEKPDFSGYPVDAVIYEASIRDMTCHLNDERKGTFLGLVEEEDKGLNYISSLGVTHLQLQPIFDFGGVDDLQKDSAYNWGYNPEQYFVPSGWYSCNPNDPYSRLNELLKLVDEAHKRGLRVVMDVVYNHVYTLSKFSLEQLVPGYFFRVDAYGNYTNVCGCGNDFATEKRMGARFILDNLKYFATQFQISGFRFDLMGLLDIETLNKAYVMLKEIDPNLILYGEGWNMPNTIPDAFRPHAYNHYKMPHYSFFNDKYRDFLKGSQWDKSRGYTFGNSAYPYDIYGFLNGSLTTGYRFLNPNQSLNYVECHDNFTLFDFATYCLGLTEEEAIRGGKLALQMVAISLGVVFIHAGEEFYRTKKGVENSYNSSEDINHLDYVRRDWFKEDIEGLKDLLKIRKCYPEFRMTNMVDIERNRIFIEELSSEHVLCYYLEGTGYRLTIVIKNTQDLFYFPLPQAEMIFNGHRAVNFHQEGYELYDVGVYIFKELKS